MASDSRIGDSKASAATGIELCAKLLLVLRLLLSGNLLLCFCCSYICAFVTFAVLHSCFVLHRSRDHPFHFVRRFSCEKEILNSELFSNNSGLHKSTDLISAVGSRQKSADLENIVDSFF